MGHHWGAALALDLTADAAGRRVGGRGKLYGAQVRAGESHQRHLAAAVGQPEGMVQRQALGPLGQGEGARGAADDDRDGGRRDAGAGDHGATAVAGPVQLCAKQVNRLVGDREHLQQLVAAAGLTVAVDVAAGRLEDHLIDDQLARPRLATGRSDRTRLAQGAHLAAAALWPWRRIIRFAAKGQQSQPEQPQQRHRVHRRRPAGQGKG